MNSLSVWPQVDRLSKRRDGTLIWVTQSMPRYFYENEEWYNKNGRTHPGQRLSTHNISCTCGCEPGQRPATSLIVKIRDTGGHRKPREAPRSSRSVSRNRALGGRERSRCPRPRGTRRIGPRAGGPRPCDSAARGDAPKRAAQLCNHRHFLDFVPI